MPLDVCRSLDALLFVESCPPSSRSVVRVSRDHSVVGAQRPGVRVSAVVELGQDPLKEDLNVIMIQFNLFIKSNRTC